MEALTRIVSESLARYGLDRPVDYRRLQWSRWFRCESLHSLLHVPSKPGIFALAEEVIGSNSSDMRDREQHDFVSEKNDREGHDFSSEPALSKRSASKGAVNPRSSAALAIEEQRRMLSVLQFHEADDMAFVLDRMLSRQNPMSARLASGKCFVRFVAIDDEIQRRSIWNALNQWLVSTGEKASGIGAHFATSLEFGVGRTLLSATANTTKLSEQAQGPEIRKDATRTPRTSPHLDSGSAANIHCPQPFPSGF